MVGSRGLIDVAATSVLGVIQVRTGSTRLPGKARLELGGRPLLEWVVGRATRARRVDRWVVATTTSTDDDWIVDVAVRHGCGIVRGSVTDVLSRFRSAIDTHSPNHVVRVCADNPFVCPDLIDELCSRIGARDYLANHRPTASTPIADGFGAEIISARALIEVDDAGASDRDKEHVTATIAERTANEHPVAVDADLMHPYLRFDVDTADDLNHVKALVESAGITMASTPAEIVRAELGMQLQSDLEVLFPLNRSLMGAANRATLDHLSGIVPLRRHSVESGRRIFDWVVPPEWTVRGGEIRGRTGHSLVRYTDNHLHVMTYSRGVDETVGLEELLRHVHAHARADAIPYRTAYYSDDWGFCVTHAQREAIVADGGPFHVVIDAAKHPGTMDFADIVVAGSSTREILVSTYFCHPSLANDSLSGVLLTAHLARFVASLPQRKYTYRFAFVPETIGALAYVHHTGSDLGNVDFGLQITTVGGPGTFHVKRSWEDRHPINALVDRTLEACGVKYEVLPFDIHGSDERQYSSPGLRLNMTTIARDMYYTYPQYHTSLDNLDFVNGRQIAETLGIYCALIREIEDRRVFVRVDPVGEPMLRRHDLHDLVGGSVLPGGSRDTTELLLWIAFLCDGINSVDDIGRRLDEPVERVLQVCDVMVRAEILREI
jgi:aminopeptidase-like protein/spore coat polysaccharide biosynthesis protein SpsF (cytidylyltransferase family)